MIIEDYVNFCIDNTTILYNYLKKRYCIIGECGYTTSYIMFRDATTTLYLYLYDFEEKQINVLEIRYDARSRCV